MRLVEHDEVPGLLPVQHSAARSRRRTRWLDTMTNGSLMPFVAIDDLLVTAPHRRRRIPGQLLAVVDRPVEVELLAQLDLPLRTDRLRRQDQHALGPPGEPRLPQQQTGLDRLPSPTSSAISSFGGQCRYSRSKART